MKPKEILETYTQQVNDQTVSFADIRKGDLYQNQVMPLAEKIVELLALTEETSLLIGKIVYIVTPRLEEGWTIAHPYYNSEVIEYYAEHPPKDVTEEVYAIELKK